MTYKRIRIILDSKSAEKNAKDLDRAVTGVGGAADKTQFAMSRLAGVISAVIAAKQVIDYADAWTKVQNQLRRTVNTTEELASISGTLLGVANQTRSALDSTVDLYTSLYISTENLGLSQEKLVGVTKTINNLFLESGKGAAESAGAIRQLGQALQSGALRGDEFNSVAEGAPGILRAIQKETGLTRAELRKLAEDGKITSELIVTSLQNYSDTAQAAADKTQTTLDQALTTSKNTFTALVGAIDSGTGATKSLAEAIQSVAEALGSPEFIDGVRRYSQFFGDALGTFVDSAKLNLTGFFNIVKAGFTDETVKGAFDDYVKGFADISAGAKKAIDELNKPFSMVPAAASAGSANEGGFTPVKMKGDGGLQEAIDRENAARREIASAQSLTKQLQAELDYRTQIAKIYRDNEISGQMSYYDQQRSLLDISIHEDLAKMQNKAIEDQIRRSEAFTRAMENDALEREERAIIEAEFAAQEIIATEILEQEKTAIKDREKKAREELDRAEWQSRLDNAAMLGGALMQYGEGQSKKVFKIGQRLALAQAAVALPSAVLQSFQNGGGYPWGLIPAAAMLATGLKNIQQIRNAGAGMGGGGGGGAPSASIGSGGGGSTIPTTANSAEQVQQKRIIELRGIRPGDMISGEQLAGIFESDDNVVVAFENARADAQRRNVIGVTAR